jgi:OMF family outer membrane factor
MKYLFFFLFLCPLPIFGQTWTLRQAVDSAWANNERVAISLDNEEIAALKRKETRANLLPKLNIAGEYKYYVELPYQLMPMTVFGGPEGQFKAVQFGVEHNINAGVALQMPLYSPQLNGAIRKVEASEKMWILETKKTHDQLYYEVSSLYRNIQLISSQTVFMDSTIQNSEKMLQNLEQLAAEKLLNRTDVQKMELKISGLRLYQQDLKVKLAQLYNALYLLTGQEDIFQVEESLQIFELQDYEINESTEIQLLKAQQEILSIDLQTLKRSRYLPEIGLMANYVVQGFGYDRSPNQFLDFYNSGYTGLRFNFPVFNGTVTQKKIAQKNLELDNALRMETLARDAQKMQVENALLQLKNDFAKITLSEDQMHLARAIYQQEEKKQLEGLASVNDLLIAQNEWITSRQTLLQSIAAYLATDLELKKLTNINTHE